MSNYRGGGLMLSRQRGEKVVIGPPGGPQVVLTVLEVRGHAIRLGIEAPAEVPVVRGEVMERQKGGGSCSAG